MREAPAKPPPVPLLAPSAWVHASAILAYLALAVVMTWPVAAGLGSRIPIAHQIPGWQPGDGDPWQSLWLLDLTHRSLRETGRIPFWTDRVFAPLGLDMGLLAFVAVPLLAAAPLVALVGAVAAYNLTIIGSLAAAGYGAFLLARHVSGDRAAAFVGGLIFGFAPYHLAHSLEHVFLVSGSIWLALGALLLLRAVDEGGLRLALLAGAGMVLATAVTSYYGVFLALLGAVLLAVRLGEAPCGRARLIGRLAAAAGAAALLALPFAVVLARRSLRDSMLVTPLGDVNQWSADLAAILVPSRLHPLWGGMVAPFYDRLPGNLFEQTVFAGYVPLALAVAGAGWRWGRARLWTVVAAVFFVLSLGPLLHVLGRWTWMVDGMGVTLPLPGLLFRWLPGLGAVRVFSRFNAVVMLAIAVLAALAIASLRARLRSGGRRRLAAAVAPVVAGVVLVEFASVPLPVLGAGIPEAYRALARDTSPGRVLEVPYGWTIARYLHYQTAHGRPLVGGFAPRPSVALISETAGVPFLDLFAEPVRALTVAPPADPEAGVRVAALLGLRAIVLHGEYMPAAARARLREIVTASFPVERVEEGGDLTLILLRRAPPDPGRWLNAGAYELDLGSGGPRDFLARGWYGAERHGGVGMAWSAGRESTLGVYLPEARAMRMELSLMPLALPGLPRQDVSVNVNGTDLGVIALDPGWRGYTLDVPREAVREGFNRIRFRYGFAVAPGRVVPGLDDPRELAVAFERVRLRPR